MYEIWRQFLVFGVYVSASNIRDDEIRDPAPVEKRETKRLCTKFYVVVCLVIEDIRINSNILRSVICNNTSLNKCSLTCVFGDLIVFIVR